VDQLRRERSLRPSHVVDGGGDASQVDNKESFEFERPFTGPSHVDDGGGDEFNRKLQAPNQWLIRPKFPEVELLTEARKKELKREMAEIEHYRLQDSRFHSFMWTLKYKEPGPERYKAIEKFWKKIYEDHPPHDESLIFRSYSMQDFLQARDESDALEHPMRPPPNTSSWGHPWSRRSSVVTDGPGSLSSSKVGTESVPGSGLTGTCVASGHPPYT
jgi:hypothetical protein